MQPDLESLVNRVQQGLSALELVHTPHALWPLPQNASNTTNRLRISVLDSSFNPPTLAHLALANTPLPKRSGISDPPSQPLDFNARLLLLSVRNADKSLKTNDAIYSQRLEMMTLLAKGMSPGRVTEISARSQGSEPLAASLHAEANVAVAIVDEPTFVGKSRILHEFLQKRLSSFTSNDVHSMTDNSSSDMDTPLNVPQPELTFLVGIDTLERILAVRYYTTEENMRRSLKQFLSADGDASRLICARRVTPGSLESPVEREQRISVQALRYLEEDCVTMVDLGEDIESYSSSEVRQRIIQGDTTWARMVPTAVAEYIKRQGLYLPTDEN